MLRALLCFSLSYNTPVWGPKFGICFIDMGVKLRHKIITGSVAWASLGNPILIFSPRSSPLYSQNLDSQQTKSGRLFLNVVWRIRGFSIFRAVCAQAFASQLGGKKTYSGISENQKWHWISFHNLIQKNLGRL